MKILPVNLFKPYGSYNTNHHHPSFFLFLTLQYLRSTHSATIALPCHTETNFIGVYCPIFPFVVSATTTNIFSASSFNSLGQ